MKNKLSLLLTAFVLIVFAACNKPVSTLAVYVPKDASAVFVIDTKSITDKITSSGISLDSLAAAFEENKDSGAIEWNDIKNSGIDLAKPFYVFSKSSNAIQSGGYNGGALIAEIADAIKLEDFLKKKKPGATISNGGNYSYLKLNNNCIAGWTEKVFIVVAFNANGSPASDTLAQNQLKTMFTQKESESIVSLDAFKGTFKKAGDIHFYTNTSSGLNNAPMAGMTKMNDLLEDSYTDGAINFEKGKIVAEGEMHYNKNLAGIINKYPQQEIKLNMLQNYPKPLTGFGIIAFNPKLLVDVLHYLSFDAMADGFTSNIGFTTGDVVNAFSGDIAIMFSASPEKDMAENSLKNGSFLTVAAVGDKAAFDKVMKALLDKGLLSKNGDAYQLGMAGGHGFVIEKDDKNLFIASSDELVKSYLSAGNKQALPAGLEKEMNNKSMAAYFDINAFLQNKTNNDSATIDVHAYDNHYTVNVAKSAKETFKNIMMFAEKGDERSILMNYQLNFVNENDNSLASLTRFMLVAKKEGVKRNGWDANHPLSNMHDEDSLHEHEDSVNAQ